MRRKLVGCWVVFMLLYLNIFSLPIAGSKVYATDFGSGLAGDVTITTARSLSSFANKNFRNLIIDAGGVLTVDVDAVIYVSQSLIIRNGGRITSINGTNGSIGSRYDYDNWVYYPVSATPAKTVTINAANISIQSNGRINSGTGGTGYPSYWGSSYRWGPGPGANGGDIKLSFNSLTLNNGKILSGDGGLSYNAVAYKNSAGSGGSGGNVNLSGISITLMNNGTIETGNGTYGANARSCWSEDSTVQLAYAGNGGLSGSVYIAGTSLNIDVGSWIKTGTGGKAGVGLPEGGGVCYGAYGGTGGASGGITLIGFTDMHLYGLLQSGTGGEGGNHSEFRYYTPAAGTAGGSAGSIYVYASNLHVYPTGRVLGGAGGKGGSLTSYAGSTGTGGPGGKGGNVTLSAAGLVLDSGSLASSGNGGPGGDGSGGGANGSGYLGGTGGQGGDVTINISNTITKANEVNVKTGQGGNGGEYASCFYYSGDYYYYYWNGGPGGKGGNAVFYLPSGMNINYNLIEIGAGGIGHNVSANYGTSTSYYSRNYNPGNGGATGDLTVNVTGSLTLSGTNVFCFAKSGCGNVWTANTTVKSKNGSSGNCSFNVTGQLRISAENAIYFDDMAHSGYETVNNSVLTLNCPNIDFTGITRPFKWSNISGGTLTLITDLRQFPYGYEKLTGFTKDPAQTIGSYILKFTYVNTEDLFRDIPAGWVQDGLSVSFNLDETVYGNYLQLFNNVRRYMSEDNGVNWQEITYGSMSRDYVWGAPSTIVGNTNLLIGLIPYGFASGIQEIWLNGVKLNTYWTPSNVNPPIIRSNKFAIVDPAVLAKEAALEAKAASEEVYDFLLSDRTPPVVEVETVSGARATSGADIELVICVSDNASTEFTYSVNSDAYEELPADGKVRVNLTFGMNILIVRVKDQEGNIGQKSIKIWRI